MWLLLDKNFAVFILVETLQRLALTLFHLHFLSFGNVNFKKLLFNDLLFRFDYWQLLWFTENFLIIRVLSPAYDEIQSFKKPVFRLIFSRISFSILTVFIEFIAIGNVHHNVCIKICGQELFESGINLGDFGGITYD